MIVWAPGGVYYNPYKQRYNKATAGISGKKARGNRRRTRISDKYTQAIARLPPLFERREEYEGYGKDVSKILDKRVFEYAGKDVEYSTQMGARDFPTVECWNKTICSLPAFESARGIIEVNKDSFVKIIDNMQNSGNAQKAHSANLPSFAFGERGTKIDVPPLPPVKRENAAGKRADEISFAQEKSLPAKDKIILAPGKNKEKMPAKNERKTAYEAPKELKGAAAYIMPPPKLPGLKKDISRLPVREVGEIPQKREGAKMRDAPEKKERQKTFGNIKTGEKAKNAKPEKKLKSGEKNSKGQKTLNFENVRACEKSAMEALSKALKISKESAKKLASENLYLKDGSIAEFVKKTERRERKKIQKALANKKARKLILLCALVSVQAGLLYPFLKP
ncbi:hypothetical protein COU37_00940 [Candidatus Micrarchaeota archaeon CG10_big_fil_rev_8_21_14_0_10_45_29]|nr:MAG: hypothetical protein COU37_00940 [Candidatus Micrarchaeota archaeon CG10_big_fil_rev_8_21_14_0_10_45_29]